MLSCARRFRAEHPAPESFDHRTSYQPFYPLFQPFLIYYSKVPYPVASHI